MVLLLVVVCCIGEITSNPQGNLSYSLKASHPAHVLPWLERSEGLNVVRMREGRSEWREVA